MDQSESAGGRTRRTILIVDDDPGTLHVLSSGIGTTLDLFDVVTASDGREAVEILERRTVDAVVTDLAMPVLDGFALIAHITNMKRTLPVVVLSGLSPSDIDERLARFGGLRVLHKPASYQDVAEVLIRTLERVDLGQVQGIPLSGVLQLVESERRSCTVVVGSGRRKGRLYFQSGRLINAFSEDFGADGEAAAYDILGWADTSIAFEPLPEDVRKQIHTPMQLMLIEVAVTQDQLRERTERSIPPAGNGAAGNGAAAHDEATDHAEDAGPTDDDAAETSAETGSPEPEAVATSAADAAASDGVGGDAERDGDRPEGAALGTDERGTGDSVDEAPAAEDLDDEANLRLDEEDDVVTSPTDEGHEAVDATSADPNVSAMVEAIARLTQRAREADAALAAVADEVQAFRAARRAFDEAFERRERRRRELEAFRHDVATLAREILGRVDAMFDDEADGVRSSTSDGSHDARLDEGPATP